MTVRKDEDQLVFILCLKILVTISGLSEIEVHLNYLKNKKNCHKVTRISHSTKTGKNYAFFLNGKIEVALVKIKKPKKLTVYN